MGYHLHLIIMQWVLVNLKWEIAPIDSDNKMFYYHVRIGLYKTPCVRDFN